jgi:hypothetical protein
VILLDEAVHSFLSLGSSIILFCNVALFRNKLMGVFYMFISGIGVLFAFTANSPVTDLLQTVTHGEGVNILKEDSWAERVHCCHVFLLLPCEGSKHE